MSQSSESSIIQQTIIRDAKAEAKRILDDAKVSANQLVEEASERAQTNLVGWAERRRQMAKGTGDRVIGKAQNDAHMRVLDARARMINTAFETARKRFEKERGKAQYKIFLKNLIVNAGSQISGSEIIVLAQKADQAIITKITGLANAISKGSGQSTKVTVGKKPVDMLGGVLVQNKAGNITVDYRIETLLNQVAQQYRNEIQNTLFPEDTKAEKAKE